MKWLAILLMWWPAVSAATSPADTTVRVTVDPRIELIGVVQLLNDYMLTTQYGFLYKRDAEAFFSGFKDHRAVTMFGDMSRASFNFDAVPKAMLALSDPPELELRTPFSPYVIRRAGGEEKLNELVAALRDFARETQFETFFAAHEGSYNQVLDSTRIAVEDAVDVLRDYSGMGLVGTTVVVGMLLHDGGFAATIEHESAQDEVFALIGPAGTLDGLPTFGTADHIAESAWHEFSHTYVNPLTELHADEIARYQSLYEPIAEQMQRQAYPSWQTAVNEHIIRAITTRLTHLNGGDAAGALELEKQKKRGFAYVDVLADRLREYEAARDEYPTFAEFYPRLIDVFKAASANGGR